jgi:hypothetical protein
MLCPLRQLLNTHKFALLWHEREEDGRPVVLLGVQNDAAELAQDVPYMVNGKPVVLCMADRVTGEPQNR